MANTKASVFTTKTTAYEDTTFVSPKPGNGAAAENCQFALPAIRDQIVAGLKSAATMVGSAITKSLPAGKWMYVFAVTNATGSTQTFNAGLTLGGTDVVPGGEVPAGATLTFPVFLFEPTAGRTLHLTPISGGSLQFNFLII